MRTKLSLLLLALFLTGINAAEAASFESAKEIPIQHNGRVKPFDAYARRTVKLITGKESWDSKPAYRVIMDCFADAASISSKKWIRVDFQGLKDTLALPRLEEYYSLEELTPSFEKLESIVRGAKEKRDRDERPTLLDQKAELLYAKVNAVDSLVSGDAARFIPPAQGAAWQIPFREHTALGSSFLKVLDAYRSGDAGAFEKESRSWIETAQKVSPEVQAPKIKAEIFYLGFKPFEWSAFFYFLGFALLGWDRTRAVLRRLGFGSICAALFLHTLGLGFRIFILGRPPVSNMYESMIFMNWAVMFFAVVFSVLRKNSVPLAAGALLSGLVMLYADLLPIDSSLDVLVPVLRSNYWLSIHVLTVVSSYGAFGLAMALGHRHLFCVVRRKFTPIQEKESAGLILRVIQIGVILIGTGTVLGGVWANESWGRFWGWDPKETWALITFLGYLVIIHLRFAERLSNFGLALGSVLGFLLVLMTWYGVNFVLGRGLHSYGSGIGGMNWVLYYLLAETLFLLWVLLGSRVLPPARPRRPRS